jgi:ATP-binding cassette subfamily B protein
VHGEISVGTFVAFIAYQTRFLPPLQALMGLYASVATAQVSLERVSEILDAPVDVIEAADAVAPESVRGHVEFSDVTLSFGRGRAAVEELSFHAKPGEVLAIVGPSGSGKSTVADLLLRLLDPDDGVVRLDGTDLRRLNLRVLRRHVALVEQDPCILHASIAENIRYSRPESTDAEIREAARQAALEPFIASLPQGYDTIVGERGYKLSGGEKQRIALARVMLKNPRILVLDEATSALDTVSERLIQAAIERVQQGRTTVAIAHRLSTILRADLIVVMERGRIIERGRHDELLAHGGLYARLYREQFLAESGAEPAPV